MKHNTINMATLKVYLVVDKIRYEIDEIDGDYHGCDIAIINYQNKEYSLKQLIDEIYTGQDGRDDLLKIITKFYIDYIHRGHNGASSNSSQYILPEAFDVFNLLTSYDDINLDNISEDNYLKGILDWKDTTHFLRHYCNLNIDINCYNYSLDDKIIKGFINKKNANDYIKENKRILMMPNIKEIIIN